MNALATHVTAPAGEPDEATALHLRLTRMNAVRMKPSLGDDDWTRGLRDEFAFRVEEGEFVERERAAVAGRTEAIPRDADAFMHWYEGLRETGPGQGDPLFPWLATRASRTQMRWFLAQEVGGEAGFDDLVAMTQVRFPTRAKLEMARNYWDEMGRGHERGMHGPMLDAAARELDVHATPEATVWESLALANLMAALAANRRYAYQSVGALGVIEMTAPGRVGLVNDGLKRLKVSPTGRQYFQLHAGLDIRHSEEWNREVLRPLVAADPALTRPIGEGALLRLRCGERAFVRYRAELGLS